MANVMSAFYGVASNESDKNFISYINRIVILEARSLALMVSGAHNYNPRRKCSSAIEISFARFDTCREARALCRARNVLALRNNPAAEINVCVLSCR